MRLLVLLAAPVLSAAASAATFIEGTDYIDAPVAMLGTIGAGSHTIAGTLTGECTGNSLPLSCLFGADPQDIVRFSMAPGARLTGLSFTLTSNANAATGFGMDFIWSSPIQGGGFLNLAQGGANDPAGLALGGSEVTLAVQGGEADFPLFYEGGWRVQLVAAPVPLPGAAGLLMLGLGALGGTGRTRGPKTAGERRRQSVPLAVPGRQERAGA